MYLKKTGKNYNNQLHKICILEDWSTCLYYLKVWGTGKISGLPEGLTS